MEEKTILKYVMSWINKEINYVNQQDFKRYDKERHKGYVQALKKIQARIDHPYKYFRLDEIKKT